MGINKIIFLGPIPPPVHGMASVNSAVLEQLGGTRPLVINISRPFGSKFGLFLKVSRAVAGFFKVLFRVNWSATLYASVDDDYGSFLQLPIVVLVRFRTGQIFLHHHSYRYISQKKVPMRLLVAAAGPNAKHIFLCDEMAAGFRAIYKGNYGTVVCPNPVTDTSLVDFFSGQFSFPNKPAPTIGFISNLMFEKGIGEFVELLYRVSEANQSWRGLMAGKATRDNVQVFVNRAKDALGDVLLLLGAVSGQQKIDFFSSVDVVIFPTRYKTEAFPIVLMESLLAGCPVFTTRRGCIPYFQDLESVYLVEDEEHFVEEAYQVLCEWFSRPERIRELKIKAHEEGMRLHMLHSHALQNLAVEILSS